jgi:hypothetical protein
MKQTGSLLFPASLGLLLLLGSCGIEDYLYLYPVSPGNIRLELNTLAVIDLPDINTSEYYYFSYFTLYYRIYISDIPESGDMQLSQNFLSRINPVLSSDYTALEPSTNTETMVSTTLASLFRNRNYYSLALQDAVIEDVLSRGSLGRTVQLDFSQRPGTYPSLNIDTGGEPESYILYRSNGNGVFTPMPNRYFLNAAELSRNDYLTAAYNADVAGNTMMTGPERYSYVSIYIVVTGMDQNYSPIYSRPTHAGIFRLPNPN